MKKIIINTDTIELDQFLKWANLASTGGEAKSMIKKGNVMVNGEIEKRRSTTLSAKDIIKVADEKYQIIVNG
ncbi:RNA-binding S4 domain-containing protein [Fuchsiella alkaliacetigena]|uniref:RNA-binding S4 domain-containing protein n=1 Tax=Fuchsiella alkaliacetigena TaxID=957042 RepID=UPI00200B97A9|nr:RNA-binding S4 domain-containing protein [Fuchsiella alkaliacetigena]MCK8824525.1 RNA-binding S4 domain-containing protein [Fuchsiella alkaliacetigena]